MEAYVGVVDTGFVVALLNTNDKYHQAAVTVYKSLSDKVLLPQTVLAETAYLVGKFGNGAIVPFLRGLRRSRFQLYPLTEQDLTFVAGILEQYEDSRIDFVDATVMAVAESHKLQLIFTIDHRDFSIYRPKNVDYFSLLPSVTS